MKPPVALIFPLKATASPKKLSLVEDAGKGKAAFGEVVPAVFTKSKESSISKFIPVAAPELVIKFTLIPSWFKEVAITLFQFPGVAVDAFPKSMYVNS